MKLIHIIPIVAMTATGLLAVSRCSPEQQHRIATVACIGASGVSTIVDVNAPIVEELHPEITNEIEKAKMYNQLLKANARVACERIHASPLVTQEK